MAAKFKNQKTFGDVKDGATKEPRTDDLVDQLKFPHNEWVQVRPVGPLSCYGKHWIESKSKDGKTVKFPKTCLNFSGVTEDHDSTIKCPYCEASDDRINFTREFFINVIVRDLQEDEPSKKAKHSEDEKKSGFKTKGSKSWTPARVVRLTSTLVRELKKIGALNRHKDKKTGEKRAFDLSHPKYGCDVSIMYDKDAKTALTAYSVQKGDPSPLTDDEKELLLWNIEELATPESLKTAEKELERWAERNGKSKKSKGKSKDDDEDDDDDEDEDDEPKSKKSKGKPSKSKSRDYDDDEDEDDEDDEDEDDEDEPKSKGKSKSKSKGKKSKDDEDDDDEDDDLDDDDDLDEDEPKSKKGKGKSKSSREDDEDEDEDDEDDEDEDVPKKNKSKSKSKSRDDDDDDEDEDDEDDEPKSKKSKSKSKVKPKSKSRDDDDDDEDEDDEDDDDEDEDEDEDDEPKSKKKSKGKSKPAKSKKKSKGKSKSRDEDEDEDDEDDED